MIERASRTPHGDGGGVRPAARAGLTRYSRIAGALLLQDLKAIKFMFGALAAAMLAYGLAAAWSVPVTPA